MRGGLLIPLFFIWSCSLLAQERLVGKNFKMEISKTSELNPGNDYLIEGDIDFILSDNSELQLLRSMDAHNHIVRSTKQMTLEGMKLWKVSPQWKLSLNSSNYAKQVYVVVSEGFDEALFDPFKVLASYPSSNTFLIEGDLLEIQNSLLPRNDVLHISGKIAKPAVEARVIDLNLNSNRVNKIHHTYPELDGSTELISIQENRFDEADIDLLGKSIRSGLESETTDNHATEMATIISGSGNSFITGRGVAKGATIMSSNFSDAMPDSDETYLNFGVTVQNHSYGIVRENEYGVQARAFDQSAFSNKNLLHVFSSGNEGLETSTDGQYRGVTGFANLTGNLKMAKNTLVVGSVDTVGNVPSFISRGPAYDGRIKPEVVAYSVVGSSNSAALVSGVASLLQQQYRSDNAEQDIPSALAKALIINGAFDVGPEGLDFLTGYGNINAWKSLEMLREASYTSDFVANGESKSFALEIPDGAKNLKVTLCWTDPPANIGDFRALKNNLDLRLISESDTILPWILDANPTEEALSKRAVRGLDNLNNVEQVTVSNPSMNYLVEVEGQALVSDQEYFVVWHYDLEDTFEWDYPTGSDNMPYNGETDSYFRWSTTLDGIGELAYSTDEETWIVLDPNVKLSDEYWRWNNIPMLNNKVKARMVVGTDVFETEYFTVSEPIRTRVGFNCGDSLMLRWNSFENVEEYKVYSLGDEFLENYITTADTFAIVPNISDFSTKFSIEPVLEGGLDLLPSPTFDYRLQGIECFVSSFFQTVVLDTGIYLNLTLGTSYGIDEIVIERNDVSGFKEIASFQNVDTENIDFLDQNPIQGYNEHRAIIKFRNSQELIFEAGSVYYLTEVPYRIFPNPVSAGESIQIITKEFNERTPLLELIDPNGALVYKQVVQGSQDNIPTQDLQSGIYFYRLSADGNMYTGRILVR